MNANDFDIEKKDGICPGKFGKTGFNIWSMRKSPKGGRNPK